MGNYSKAAGATAGGGAGLVLTWLLQEFGGVTMPPEVAAGLTGFLGLLATVLFPANQR